MGKLKNDIDALITEQYRRGIDGQKIAMRLVEAGLKMMHDEGEITEGHRLKPCIAAAVSDDKDYDGEFCTYIFGDKQYEPPKAVYRGTPKINDEAREYITEAKRTFQGYAEQHLAKDPPQCEKAARNIYMARRAAELLGHDVPEVGAPGCDDIEGLIEQCEKLLDARLPVKVAEVTGNIAEGELAARYVDLKIAGAREFQRRAASQEKKDTFGTIALVLTELANELRSNFHIPEVHIDGKVIPYNSDLGTGLRHADALRAFFTDVHERNVRAGWWTDIETGEPKKRNLGELMMLMVTEMSEAHRAFRNDEADDKLSQFPGLGVEFGDLLIRVADACGALAAGRITAYDKGVSNPGSSFFSKVCYLADQYEAIRKTPAAVGDAETGEPIPGMDVAVMVDAKLDFNASRPDHKIENRLKEDGKRT